MNNILLLEDLPEIRSWLKVLINQVFPDSQIHEAARVHDALGLVSAVKFQLALVDLGLPDGSGVDVVAALREAVSNIIKHSGASHCKVRCAITERQFGLTVQDNGKGIPMELDGKLDRGHGMSSMKHRAKQMQGQCLVESGPGYGTVIRLTLPL